MLGQLIVNQFWFTASLYFGKSAEDTKVAMELLEKKLDSGHYKASEHSAQVHKCFEFYLQNKQTLCLIP